MNQASLVALKAGIEKSKAEWRSHPENTGEATVAIQLPILEELVDDLIAANEVAVRAIADREKAKKGKRKK